MRSLSNVWKAPALIAALICGCGGGGGEADQKDAIEQEETYFDADSSEISGNDLEEIETLPDPAFFFKVDKHSKVVSDDEYAEEFSALYRTADKLKELDVRVIAVKEGNVFAGTSNGIFFYDKEEDSFINLKTISEDFSVLDGAVVDIAVCAEIDVGYDIFAYADRIVILTTGELGGIFVVSAPEGEIIKSAGAEASCGKFWFGTNKGLHAVSGDLTGENGVLSGFEARDIAVDKNGIVWIATEEGLKVFDGKDVVSHTSEKGMLPDNDVRSVASCGEGNVIAAGTLKGLSIIKDNKATLYPAGVNGLPMDQITAISCYGDSIIMGHATGATVLDSKTGHIDHYVSLRWLPDNKVTAVAIDSDGNRWFGTQAGISRISFKKRKLQEKMDIFEALQDAYFWRMDGFVPAGVWTPDPWSPWPLDSVSVGDFDNDGLWTQMQIGAWCMAYSVTGEEKFYQKARKAMEVMFLEIDVPAGDFEKAGLGKGFVTRSLVREDETALYEQKSKQSNWHPASYEGKNYYWKDDTSSDETTGHFFGYSFYYDLCAKDDAERKEVADHAGALAGYILKHGFQLLDLDGKKTTFGHWQPDYIAVGLDGIEACLNNGYDLDICLESHYGGGWLNGIEILGHMLAAWHMTGDKKFYEGYDELVTKYRYDELVKFTDDIFTVTAPAIANHSDHELAMLAYAVLLRYEPNADRRAKWLDSLLKFYKWEIPERNPVWAGVVALYSEDGAMVENAVRTLREIPVDLRDWLVDNSHRKDAVYNGKDRFDDPQWDRVFPYDEIRTVWWNGNFYAWAGGGSGNTIQGPMAWLLGYWILKYAGVLL